MDNIKLKIIETIESNKKEQIEFLQKMVQTKSVNPAMENPMKSSPYDPVELDLAKLIFLKLEEIGLNPKLEGLSKSRPNVVCEFGEGERTLIFNGHMDTVPASNGYEFPPFSGGIKGNKLFGVGSLDMKAALCAYIFMAKAMAGLERQLNGKICLQFVIDEEPMAASHFGTHYLLEKGYVGDAAIVGEPGTKRITIGNKGGYRFKLEVFGDAVHTGTREWEEKTEGINAIGEMSKAIYALQRIDFPADDHPVFMGKKNVFTFPTVIHGGRAINIVPDSCVAFGDMRLMPGMKQNDIENKINQALEAIGINYKLTPVVYVPSSLIDSEENIVGVLQRARKEIIGSAASVGGSGPWSDMWMFIQKGIPAVNFGPDGANPHDKNEYVEIQSMIDVTKIYALAALDFFG